MGVGVAKRKVRRRFRRDVKKDARRNVGGSVGTLRIVAGGCVGIAARKLGFGAPEARRVFCPRMQRLSVRSGRDDSKKMAGPLVVSGPAPFDLQIAGEKRH